VTIGVWLTLIPLAHIAAIAWPLAITDIRQHRLPNALTLPAVAVTQLTLLVASIVDGAWGRYLSSLIAFALVAAIGLVLAMANSMGMGDTKLLLATTPLLAWHSPAAAFTAAALAVLLAGAWAFLVLWRGAAAKAAIALGPFLLLGFGASAVGLMVESMTATS
jgi:leader peptidase (prepilin peptidase) / N-methyltransferase